MRVHPTALVHPDATLGEVTIGAYAIIGPQVHLADGVSVGSHCVLEGAVQIGENTTLHPHVVLGGPPQDKKHDHSTPTRLVIGAHNVFREFVTAHRGSSGGVGITRIGDHNYFMANSHVAHDCTVGDGTMFANSAAIAGHVEVHDGAILGGLCAVHQRTRIGRLSMVGGGAMCAQDVPPFTMVQGDRAKLYGINIIGLRRSGASNEVIGALKDAWRTLFVDGLPRKLALHRVEDAHADQPEVQEMLHFIRSSDRGVCRAGLR